MTDASIRRKVGLPIEKHKLCSEESSAEDLALTQVALLSLRTLTFSLAALWPFAFGSLALAQESGSSMFGGHASPPPSSTSASLPDAPVGTAPMVRGAMSKGEQPLVLPRNYQIAFASSRSNLPAKVRYYLGSTWSIRNLAEAFLIAGIPNITPAPPMPAGMDFNSSWDIYTDQITRWGKQNEVTMRYHLHRMDVGLATVETRDLASNLVLPVLLHQQAQFIPAPLDASFSERMANAAESIVITQNDMGRRVPNYSKLGGTVAAALMAKEFYASALDAPELSTGRFALKYVGYSLLGDLATNTAHELIRSARVPEMQMYETNGRSTEDSYYPLSIGGKAIYWLHSTYSPRIFLTAGFIASLPSIPKRPVEPLQGNPSTWGIYPSYDEADVAYGSAMYAWKDSIEVKSRQLGRRFGGGLAEVESQQLLQNFIIPEAFGMDPRYIPLGNGHTAGQRTAHAFSSLFIGHMDSGNKTINLPVLGGTMGAAFAAKEIYYPQIGTPELATTSLLMRTVGLNLAADGLFNVLSEFFGHRSY